MLPERKQLSFLLSPPLPRRTLITVTTPALTAAKRLSLEELANTITHGIGLLLSISGFVVLLVFAILRGTASHIVAYAIYGATLISLYAASTFYHAVISPRLKRALKIFDHSAIYLLIAGTYTPFLLLNLRGSWGWSLLGVVWSLAFAGIIFKFWFVDHFPFLSTAIYIAMGWLIVIAAKPVLAHVPTVTVLWILVGGVFYSSGVVFYAWKRLPYSHVVWHLFVLAGSACHYVAVFRSVLPTHV
jgi:hemolysin III